MWVNAQIIVFLTVAGNRSEGDWSDIGSSRKDASPAALCRGHKTSGPQAHFARTQENLVLLHVVQNSYREQTDE